jgi:hypothetical protein
MDGPLLTFLCGMGGSIAVELVTLVQAYEHEPINLPARYRQVGFYIVRSLLVVAAGLLAVAYGVYDRPILSVNIGASAPLLIQALARGIQSAPTGRQRLSGARGRSRANREGAT